MTPSQTFLNNSDNSCKTQISRTPFNGYFCKVFSPFNGQSTPVFETTAAIIWKVTYHCVIFKQISKKYFLIFSFTIYGLFYLLILVSDRGESRKPKAIKVEIFVSATNGSQPLTVTIKNFVLDATGVRDL